MRKVFRFRHFTRRRMRFTDVIVNSIADIEALVSVYNRQIKNIYVSDTDLYLKYLPARAEHEPAYPVYYIDRRGRKRYIGVVNFRG